MTWARSLRRLRQSDRPINAGVIAAEIHEQVLDARFLQSLEHAPRRSNTWRDPPSDSPRATATSRCALHPFYAAGVRLEAEPEAHDRDQAPMTAAVAASE